MERVEPIHWTEDDFALWARIAAHDFEAPGAALTFAGRLARDHGWGLAEARAAIDEYRRFCFLAVRAGHEVTPSEEVDEVWHQHLTYSRDYWHSWCRHVLRRDLHHGPTLGGPAESRRFAEQYAETLAAYEARFGPPPATFWPGTAERFGRHPAFQTINARTHLVLRRPDRCLAAWLRSVASSALFVACLIYSGPARAEGLGVLDWSAGSFLAFYLAAIALSAAAAHYLPLLMAEQPAVETRREPLAPLEIAMLAGGWERAGDVLILEALAAGDAAVAKRVILVDGQATDRAALLRDLSRTLNGVRNRLADQGLILQRSRRSLFRCVGAAVMVPVIGLGVLKLIVGLDRDKPVGILFFLLAVTSIGTMVAAVKRRTTTLAGRRAVDVYRQENDRAIRAPRSNEVIPAFACLGAAALVCSDFSDYGELLKGSGDGGGGGCGGGGGGCGGGGCGGCGS